MSEDLKKKIEKIEKKLLHGRLEIQERGIEQLEKKILCLNKDIEATNTALETHYERINELEKRLETLGINVNYIRYKMSDLEKKINDFSNYIHEGIGNTIINNKNEINELKEKITWLSEENAKLYTQMDNDALKRANLEKLLRELLLKLDGKEKDSGGEKRREGLVKSGTLEGCHHSKGEGSLIDSKLSEEKLDGKIITTEEAVDKCKEFARKVQEEIKDFQKDRESVVMNDPITKAYMKEIKENFPNLKEHEIDTSRNWIELEKDCEYFYDLAHHGGDPYEFKELWKDFKDAMKASRGEKVNFRKTKKGKYYDKSKGHVYPCKSCLYEFNVKDDNTCGQCHTYTCSHNGEFIEFFKAWKPKENVSGGEQSEKDREISSTPDATQQKVKGILISDSKLSEPKYPESLINLIDTTDFEGMAYLDWYKLIWDTAIKQWKIDNSCDINATYYVKGQRKMQKELIEEINGDLDYFWFVIEDAGLFDLITPEAYKKTHALKKKWKEKQ